MTITLDLISALNAAASANDYRALQRTLKPIRTTARRKGLDGYVAIFEGQRLNAKKYILRSLAYQCIELFLEENGDKRQAPPKEAPKASEPSTDEAANLKESKRFETAWRRIKTQYINLHRKSGGRACKRHWIAMMKKYHPDVNPSVEAAFYCRAFTAGYEDYLKTAEYMG